MKRHDLTVAIQMAVVVRSTLLETQQNRIEVLARDLKCSPSNNFKFQHLKPFSFGLRILSPLPLSLFSLSNLIIILFVIKSRKSCFYQTYKIKKELSGNFFLLEQDIVEANFLKPVCALILTKSAEVDYILKKATLFVEVMLKSLPSTLKSSIITTNNVFLPTSWRWLRRW